MVYVVWDGVGWGGVCSVGWGVVVCVVWDGVGWGV